MSMSLVSLVGLYRLLKKLMQCIASNSCRQHPRFSNKCNYFEFAITVKTCISLCGKLVLSLATERHDFVSCYKGPKVNLLSKQKNVIQPRSTIID